MWADETSPPPTPTLSHPRRILFHTHASFTPASSLIAFLLSSPPPPPLFLGWAALGDAIATLDIEAVDEDAVNALGVNGAGVNAPGVNGAGVNARHAHGDPTRPRRPGHPPLDTGRGHPARGRDTGGEAGRDTGRGHSGRQSRGSETGGGSGSRGSDTAGGGSRTPGSRRHRPSGGGGGEKKMARPSRYGMRRVVPIHR